MIFYLIFAAKVLVAAIIATVVIGISCMLATDEDKAPVNEYLPVDPFGDDESDYCSLCGGLNRVGGLCDACWRELVGNQLEKQS